MNRKIVKASFVLAVLGVLAQDAYAIKLQGSDGDVFICPNGGHRSKPGRNLKSGYVHGCGTVGRPDAPLSFDAAVLLAATPLTQRIELLEGEVRQKNTQIASLTVQLENLIREVNELKKGPQPQ